MRAPHRHSPNSPNSQHTTHCSALQLMSPGTQSQDTSSHKTPRLGYVEFESRVTHSGGLSDSACARVRRYQRAHREPRGVVSGFLRHLGRAGGALSWDTYPYNPPQTRHNFPKQPSSCPKPWVKLPPPNGTTTAWRGAARTRGRQGSLRVPARGISKVCRSEFSRKNMATAM